MEERSGLSTEKVHNGSQVIRSKSSKPSPHETETVRRNGRAPTLHLIAFWKLEDDVD